MGKRPLYKYRKGARRMEPVRGARRFAARLGQNFLLHPATAERIADIAGLSKNDTVLEIGPGTGMLTRPLLARAKKVIAVEADEALVKELRQKFAGEIHEDRLELIHGDIRDFSFAWPIGHAKEKSQSVALPSALPEGYKVAANIPYYLTGEILRLLLSDAHQPAALTLLVQKEVAERIVAKKSARAKADARPKESLLSLSVKAYGTPKYEFTVPRGSFVPAPKVDSAALTVRDISRARFGSADEEKRFFALLHAGFAHKRKLLVGNLETFAPRKDALSAFAALSIPAHARAEDLTIEDWTRLAAAMHTSRRTAEGVSV